MSCSARRGASRSTRLLGVSEPEALKAAVKVVKKGGVLAFPTETVYGLGVKAGDRNATARLRRMKGRSAGKPFQILVSSARKATELCPSMPAAAKRLARKYWPGPLTLVIKASNGRFVGLRLPDHDPARRLIAMCGGALVATSANIADEKPAVTAAEVLAYFDGKLPIILDGGRSGIGKASSVVKCVDDKVIVLREGAISEAAVIKAAFAGIRRDK